jgi:bacillolysin
MVRVLPRWAGLRTLVMAGALGAALIVTAASPHGQTTPTTTPSRGVTVTAGADDLRALSDWDRQVTRLSDAGALRIASTREDTLIAGRSHERYEQYYQGVRVFGAQMVRQVNDGQAVSVFGTYHPAITLDTHATISEDDALARAATLTGGVPLGGVVPELVVLPKDDGTYALTWYVRVLTRKDLVALFIDAKSGDEAFRYSDLQTDAAVGSSIGVLGDKKKISTDKVNGVYYAQDRLRPPSIITYDLRGSMNRTFNVLDGLASLGQSDIASDTDNSWTDGANADAHVYLGYTYDYYFKRFGRKGLNNADRSMLAIVHPVNRSDIFTAPEDALDFFLNAFWCGGCGPGGVGMITLGEGLPVGFYLTGSGQYVNYFAGALDIVSHEMSHGVTQYTSNLIYRNESGALNEAFSDIMGTSVEFFFQPPGNGPEKADYLMGEDAFVPFAPGSISGIRSAADPGLFGDPDHYSKRYTGAEDNGGVHTNCTIATHAFYLAIEGGTNRTSGMSVQGVGAANRDQIEKVFYRGFTSLLPPDATYSVARRATVQAASDLYGTNSAAYRAVTQAWDAVGVF